MHKLSRLRGNTFVGLLLLMVALVGVSVALAGSIAYAISARALEYETRQAVLLREAQTRNRIDSEIQSAQAMFLSLAVNSDILDQLTRMTSRTPEDILRFRQILSALYSLQMGSDNAAQPAVYFQRSDSLATQDGKFPGRQYFETRYGADGAAAILDGFSGVQAFSLRLTRTVEGQTADVLVMGKSLPYYSSYPFGGALVEVPLDRLRDMLMPEQGSVQLVLGGAGETLFSSSNRALAGMESAVADAVRALISDGSAGAGDQWFDVTLDGVSHYVALSTSPVNGWRYVTALPVQDILSGIHNIKNVTVLICALTALIAGLIAWLALRRLYLPIRRLLAALAVRGAPYRPDGVLGGDIGHIHNIVNVAWNQNENMRRLLDSTREVMRQDVINNLLEDVAVDDELLIQTGLDRMNGWFRVMQLDAAALGGASPYALCRAALEEIAGEHPGAAHLICVVRPHGQAVLVSHHPEPVGAADAPMWEALVHCIQRRAGALPTLAVSRELEGIRSLHDGYLQAQEALYGALLRDRRGVVLGDQPAADGDEPENQAEGLSARDRLRNLYSHAVSRGDHLVAYLLNLLERENAQQPPQDGGRDIHETLHDMIMLESTDQRLSYLMQVAGKSRAGRISGDQVAEYLSDRYSDCNMSLSMMADHFGYTNNYLSSLIKEATGMGFSEYLTHLRVEHAAQLLRNTDLLVADIAIQAGFGHVNTLIRSFHNRHHMTPAQYRTRCREARRPGPNSP